MKAVLETPFYLEHGGRRLYAVHYRAEHSSECKGAVVICPAVAHEEHLSGRVLVEFARAAAGKYRDVLRFDYTGAGESDGEFGEAALEEWVQDVKAAVQGLRSRRPDVPIFLLGLRLGATLALLAAESEPAIAGLILWAPVLEPQKYVNELLQMQLIAHNLSGRPLLKDRQEILKSTEGGIELLGYRWRRETLTRLAELSSTSLESCVRVPTLIFDIGTSGPARDAGVPSDGSASRAGQWIERRRIEERPFWQNTNSVQLDVSKWQSHETLFQETLRWVCAHGQGVLR